MYKYVSNVTETGADPKWLILDSNRTYPEVALQLCFLLDYVVVRIRSRWIRN